MPLDWHQQLATETWLQKYARGLPDSYSNRVYPVSYPRSSANGIITLQLFILGVVWIIRFPICYGLGFILPNLVSCALTILHARLRGAYTRISATRDTSPGRSKWQSAFVVSSLPISEPMRHLQQGPHSHSEDETVCSNSPKICSIDILMNILCLALTDCCELVTPLDLQNCPRGTIDFC
jgi:hypothetical protein